MIVSIRDGSNVYKRYTKLFPWYEINISKKSWKTRITFSICGGGGTPLVYSVIMKLSFFVYSSKCFHAFIYFVSSRFEIESFFKYSIVYDAIDLMINKLEFPIENIGCDKSY